MSRKNLYILILTIAMIAFYNIFSKKSKMNHANEADQNVVTARNITMDVDGTEVGDKIENPEELASLLAVSEHDIVLGDLNSPVTIIEYSSLSCPHCKYFHENVFEVLKEKYIDSGKVKLIHRDYPLDAPSLSGAMYLKCVPKNEYFAKLKILFDKQADWAYKSNYQEKLGDFAKIDGMSEEEFQACLKNKDNEKQVLESREVAEKKLKLAATPVYIINGKMYFGLKEKEFFINKIEELLNKPGENSGLMETSPSDQTENQPVDPKDGEFVPSEENLQNLSAPENNVAPENNIAPENNLAPQTKEGNEMPAAEENAEKPLSNSEVKDAK